MTAPLSGRVALVTGSTSGIGRGIAHALAAAGCRVMLHGLGDPAQIDLHRTALQLETGTEIAYGAAEAARPEQMAHLVRETQARFGGLDILVNNAGIQHVAPVEEFAADRWAAIQDIVLNSSFFAVKAAVPEMKRRGWGRIINVASAHGLVASPFKSAYVAAKHGQVGLTRTVALELAETGVTCNAICPGYVRTPLVDEQVDSQAAAHGLPREQVIRDVILAAQPTRRFVEIAEVAALAVFLCSEQARSITGAAIPIDGGWTAR